MAQRHNGVTAIYKIFSDYIQAFFPYALIPICLNAFTPLSLYYAFTLSCRFRHSPVDFTPSAQFNGKLTNKTL
jgi:hypothetical protein